MEKKGLLLGLALLLFCSAASGQAVASSNQPGHDTDLVAAYVQHMGFAEHQVINAAINNSVLALSINECSFCGAFKDEKKRAEIAHKTLNWFLEKTGHREGTVEWYNTSRQKIMVITGSTAQAEITTGSSCSTRN